MEDGAEVAPSGGSTDPGREHGGGINGALHSRRRSTYHFRKPDECRAAAAAVASSASAKKTLSEWTGHQMSSSSASKKKRRGRLSTAEELDEDDEDGLLRVDRLRDAGAEGEGEGGIRGCSARFRRAMALLSCVAGVLCGYDAGATSTSLPLLWEHEGGGDGGQQGGGGRWEVIVGTGVAAIAFAVLLGSRVSRGLGPRTAVSLAAFLLLLAAPLQAVLLGFTQRHLVAPIAARVLQGLGNGLLWSCFPTYITEVCPSRMRGWMMGLFVWTIAAGHATGCLASAISASTRTHEGDGWRWSLGAAGIPALVLSVGFLGMPESPRWWVKRGQVGRAMRALRTIEAPALSSIGQQHQQQQQEEEEEEEEEEEAFKARVEALGRHLAEEEEEVAARGPWCIVLLEVLGHPSARRALLVGCFVHVLQQLTGITAITYYGPEVVRMTGVAGNDVRYAIWWWTSLSAIHLVFTGLGLRLSQRLGRRTQALATLPGVAVGLLLVAIGFHVQPSYSAAEVKGHLPSSSSSPLVSWTLALGGMGLFLASFASGLSIVPWLVDAELHPPWSSSACRSVSSAASAAVAVAVSFAFPWTTKAFGPHGTFYACAAWGGVALLFFYWMVPETKGRSLEEVEEGLLGDHGLASPSPYPSAAATAAPPTSFGFFSSSSSAHQLLLPRAAAATPTTTSNNVQYVHIRGLNRGRDRQDSNESGDELP